GIAEGGPEDRNLGEGDVGQPTGRDRSFTGRRREACPKRLVSEWIAGGYIGRQWPHPHRCGRLPEIDEPVAGHKPSLVVGKLIGELADHCWISGLPYHFPGAFDRW